MMNYTLDTNLTIYLANIQAEEGSHIIVVFQNQYHVLWRSTNHIYTSNSIIIVQREHICASAK